MKRFFRYCVVVVISVFSVTAVAASGASDPIKDQAALKKQVEKVSQQAAALQHQLDALRKQVKQQQKVKHKTKHKAGHKKSTAKSTHVAAQDNGGIFGHYVTVTTSPLTGPYAAYDGSDILKQIVSMHEYLQLLERRQAFENSLAKKGHKLTRPIFVISGGIEGQVYYNDGYTGNSSQSGVSLSTAELDFSALINPWVTGFISLDYDDSPASIGSREPNGRIYLRRGFVVIGNLNRFPLFFAVGEMYAPFGRYASAMLSAPLTQTMSRIRTPAAVLGFSYAGFYGSVYGYTGDQTGNSDVFRQGGMNLGYKRKCDGWNYDVGVGVVSNIADSEGMQDNGLTQPGTGGGLFRGFGEDVGSVATPVAGTGNNLRHRVPAIDAHAEVTVGPMSYMLEYTGALESFNPADMAFNTSGAEPKALHAEIDYTTRVWDRPLTLGVAYGHSWEALALNIPENSYIALAKISIWRYTVESIEFRHDTDYSSSDTASGAGSPAGSNTATGGDRNAVLFRLGVYF